MQRQNFMFNPMQLNAGSLQYSMQHNEESLKDFGSIGGGVRHRQQLQNTKPAEPLLLPPANKSRQYSEGQKENVATKNGDKLATLHSRLHQEAEKVKQWKISTEIKLKEKDRKMIEANKTIDSLRKSILELQFLNESVSSKLQEEKTLQEETVQKIGITRNMCNALKEHLAKLENSVVMGENILTVQKFENGQRTEQFQELVLKFQELEIKSNAKEHEMKKYLSKTENEHKKEADSLKRRITEGEDSIKELQEMTDGYKENMESLSEQLAQVNETLQRYEDEYASLEAKLEEAKTIYNAQENIINEEKCSKDTLMKKIESLEEEYGQKLSNMMIEYDNIKKEIHEKQIQIELQDCELRTKQEEITNLLETTQQKSLELEQMKLQAHDIYKVKTELESLVGNLRKELENVNAAVEEKEKLLKNKDEEKVELDKLLISERQIGNQLRDKISSLESEIKRLNEREEYAANLEIKMKELETEKENLQSEINEKFADIENKAVALAAWEKENQSLREEAENMMKKIEDLKTERENIKKELEIKSTELQLQHAESEKAKDMIQELEERIKELHQERDQHVDAIQQEVGSRDKRIENTENKVKSIQSRLEAKSKLANKFQSEMKSIKAQLKVQQKTNKKLEDELQAAQEVIKEEEAKSKEMLENAQQTSKESMQDYKRLKEALDTLQKEKKMLLKDVDKLGKQTELSKKQSETAQQQLIQEKQNFEAQITEMCTTLEKYKIENEKLMNAKEKEFDKQTKDLLQSKSTFEENLKEKQLEIKECKMNIGQKDKEIKELNRNVEIMNQKVKELESRLTESANSIDAKTKENNRQDSFIIAKEEKKQSTRTSFQSPKPNQAISPKVPKTPKTPQMSNPTTPTASLRTPQGILRVSEEKPPRIKHVAFNMADDQEEMSDDEDILMKAKRSPGVVSGMKKPSNINSVRPIIRASPSLSLAPMSSPVASKPASSAIESPGKRLKTAVSQNPSQKSTEQERFNKLFPKFDQKGKKRDATKSNPVPKKSPFKSKVKKLTPKAKTGKKDCMDLSWFDTDSAFGFGMEE